MENTKYANFRVRAYRLPSKPAGTDAQRIRAMSQAAYRVISDQFPTEIAVFDATMTGLGFPLNAATLDSNLPEGNVVGLNLGRKVGAQAFDKAQGHWTGRV
jgi:hypothetical protein